MTDLRATVIGAGLAGCEAAWQLAKRGIRVKLIEMKPGKKTPAHHSDDLAELVCSNSFRGDRITNAVGLLKEEMRIMDSLIIHSADKTFQMYEKLNSLEEEMESYGFIRIHRFYLVNVRYISNIHNYELTLTDGSKLPIPKGRYKEVRVKYTLFMGEVL